MLLIRMIFGVQKHSHRAPLTPSAQDTANIAAPLALKAM
jgi:hypothetical protein